MPFARLRSARLRLLLGVALAGALVAGPIAGAGAREPDPQTGTIRAIVRHNDGVTRPAPPLAGVEVWVWDGSQSHYACTNANGVARFTGMTPGGGYVAATGVSVNSPRCANADFLNPFPGPSLGKQMYTVFWNRHKGERVMDPFSVDGEVATSLLFVTSTPPNQRKICGGLKVTILGTVGDDTGPTRIVGTDFMDVINALGGNDTVLGGGDNDFICGGPGSDLLYGQDGDDFIFGENGQDLLVGGAGYDTLLGGPQGDTCTTGETVFDCEY